MKIKTIVRLIALLSLLSGITHAAPMGTAFTYQGQLTDSGTPANSSYDLKFTLFDANSGGSAVAGPLTNAAVAISNGLFTVTLDFGSGVFDGNARWLDIGVRTNGGGAFATLTPRQPLTATPYAIQAASATTAATAATAGSVPASGIGSGTANISISGNANTAISAVSAGSAALAASALNAINFTGPLAGDVTGTQGATTVERIRSVQVSASAPTTNQFLRFNGTQWVPAAVALGTDVSGTLADARLSTNVALLSMNQIPTGIALLNTNQTFTGSNTFSGVVNATNPANMFVGSFTGTGAGLANLNASALASGTLADGRLSANVALLSGSQFFSGPKSFDNADFNNADFYGDAIFSYPPTFTSSGGPFIVSSPPIMVANLNADMVDDLHSNDLARAVHTHSAADIASGTLLSERLSGTYSSAVTFNSYYNSFAGDGSGLYNLNANYLNSGTLADARLSANVPLLNMSTWTFAGKINAFQFIGDGSPLTLLNASALSSGTVPNARLSGTYSSSLTFSSSANNFSGTFTGNGSGLTGLNANNLASGTVLDARLSSNVPLVNNSPTFSTPVTMSSFLSLSRTTITVTGNGFAVTPASSFVLLAASGAYTIGGIMSGSRIGDVLILQGNSDVNTVTISNGAGVRLTAASHVLGANDTLMLIWNGTWWIELSFANNL